MAIRHKFERTKASHCVNAQSDAFLFCNFYLGNDAMNNEFKNSRRDFMKNGAGLLGGAALLAMVPPGIRSAAWAAGSDAPELKEVKVGFIPLTDCASVVIASVMKFDEKYGIKIMLSKEASWAAVRDKLVNGELHAAHVLYGLIYGVQLGIGGLKKDMSVMMTLNNNGQAITLSNQLKEKDATTGETLKKLIDSDKREYTFAQTFPTGTHAMWLYYWLANYGIDPFKDVKNITVPPPQMVANMRVGNMDGFCVGEPWGNRAIADKIGFTAATTQDIWKDHPEKVLGSTAEFTQKYPNTARALMMAVLDASKYIDVMANRRKVAEIIADKSYVNCPVEVIDQRLEGKYEDGLGKKWNDPNYMKFCNDGAVNFPYLSDGMWFLTQHKRWGLLKEDPDYLAVAKQINQIELYKQAAAQVKVPVPKDVMRSSKLIDGTVWDGKDPKKYAASFKVRA
jgi:nitrate/nitrite transport system substrate-binding protein